MNRALKSTVNNGLQVQDNASSKTLFDFGPCPRSVDEVYSLGIKLQYFIGGLYLEFTDFQQGNAKKFYKDQVANQLAVKNEIQSLANNNLNQLLTYFYENGGPIIEPPVSEQIAKEIQPFFNRIASNAMIEIRNVKEVAQEISDEEIVKKIDDTIIDMYTAMSKLFITVQDVSEAFKNLAALNGR